MVFSYSNKTGPRQASEPVIAVFILLLTALLVWLLEDKAQKPLTLRQRRTLLSPDPQPQLLVDHSPSLKPRGPPIPGEAVSFSSIHLFKHRASSLLSLGLGSLC